MSIERFLKVGMMWKAVLVGTSLSLFLTINTGIASHKPEQKGKHNSVSV